jgi:hypothetical protein
MVATGSKLQMKLSDSQFPFSRRMLNFFNYVGLSTVQDLTAIPLIKLTCFKGFKAKCKAELIAFIDFEGIESFFDGYDKWKCRH